MIRDLARVLITREQIAERVHELGEEIARALRAEVGEESEEGEIVLVPILTGAVVFVADLIRQLPLKLRLEVVAVSSYPGRSMESKGAMMRSELPANLGGRHVIIVDDILDSGQTIALLRSLIEEQGPASVRTCVLLDKQVERAVDVRAEYVGFEIPDEFVVGYGLDYDGHYRNLPEIAVLRPEAL
ncbi:MAG: hypoxanthine phosphoribosyltransferase [Phycisphaerales bacterium JB037]